MRIVFNPMDWLPVTPFVRIFNHHSPSSYA
jgi:hypothetical protein